jgi:predicted transcriptional regulator
MPDYPALINGSRQSEGPGQRLGEIWGVPSDCAGDLAFREGRCVFQRPDGSPCTSSDECERGTLRPGKSSFFPTLSLLRPQKNTAFGRNFQAGAPTNWCGYADAMIFVTTALGRMVPQDQLKTVIEDLVLKALFDYCMNPFNASNSPMPLAALAKSAGIDGNLAAAYAEALSGKGLVEKHPAQIKSADAFRITGKGVVEVQNVPQGLMSAP